MGTELLLGSIVNSDAQMISRELSALGINVYWHTVVGDNPGRLEQAVNAAKGRADILITTGGLGPTCDDLTKQTLARCFGLELEFDGRSMERIEDYFRRMDRPMTENNRQQAWLPRGCTVFDNDWGTAPGCAFQAEGVHVLMLPGPPSECLPMFRARAVALSPRPQRGGHRLPYPAPVRHRGVHGGGSAAGEDERHDQPHPGPLRQGGGGGAAHHRQGGHPGGGPPPSSPRWRRTCAGSSAP